MEGCTERRPAISRPLSVFTTSSLSFIVVVDWYHSKNCDDTTEYSDDRSCAISSECIELRLLPPPFVSSFTSHPTILSILELFVPHPLVPHKPTALRSEHTLTTRSQPYFHDPWP